MTEDEHAKLFWDYSIRIDRIMPAHQPGMTFINKTEKRLSKIDFS